jgi:hypothetical protein
VHDVVGDGVRGGGEHRRIDAEVRRVHKLLAVARVDDHLPHHAPLDEPPDR